MDTFDSNDIWTLELGLWLGGMETVAGRMVDGCLMVFPEPVGILKGDEIVDTLGQTPRWASVEMAERNILYQDTKTVCVAYRAEALRENEEPYSAFCSSVYVRQDGGWKMLSHQQTRWRRRPGEPTLPLGQVAS